MYNMHVYKRVAIRKFNAELIHTSRHDTFQGRNIHVIYVRSRFKDASRTCLVIRVQIINDEAPIIIFTFGTIQLFNYELKVLMHKPV